MIHCGLNYTKIMALAQENAQKSYEINERIQIMDFELLAFILRL